MNVELYSKPDCSLCDAARAVLVEVQRELPFELLEVDITRDPLLRERFKMDVPVVFVDGKPWFKHRIEKGELKKRLERARSFSLGTLDPQKTLSRSAPVSRRTKVLFSLVAVAAIAGVFATKGYTRFVLDERRAFEGLSAMPQDRAAPDFHVQLADDKPIGLGSYRGRLLVLNFFATWCGPCREEMPSMSALAEAVKGDDIHVLAVDVQEDWPTLKRFFGAQPPAFEIGLDETGDAATAYEQRSSLMFPETFIVTPQGRVVAKFEGARDWTDAAMLRYLRGLSRS